MNLINNNFPGGATTDQELEQIRKQVIKAQKNKAYLFNLQSGVNEFTVNTPGLTIGMIGFAIYDPEFTAGQIAIGNETVNIKVNSENIVEDVPTFFYYISGGQAQQRSDMLYYPFVRPLNGNDQFTLGFRNVILSRPVFFILIYK